MRSLLVCQHPRTTLNYADAKPKCRWLWLAFVWVWIAGEVRSADRLDVRVLSDATVIATVAPGKPGAPKETIAARKQGAAFSLLVQRIDTFGKVLMEERVGLPEAAFTSLWELIERHELRTLTPKPGSERADDYGERRLRLEWKGADATAAAAQHEIIWERAPAPEVEAKLKAVLANLGGLARQHAKRAQLYYFPTP